MQVQALQQLLFINLSQGEIIAQVITSSNERMKGRLNT